MSSTKLIGPHKIITFCGSTDIDEFNQAMQSVLTTSSLDWSGFYGKHLKESCEEKLRNKTAYLWLIYSYSDHYYLKVRNSLWRAQSGSTNLVLADYQSFVSGGFRSSWIYEEIETFIRTQLPTAALTVHAQMQPAQLASRNWYDPSNPLTSLRNQLRRTFPGH